MPDQLDLFTTGHGDVLVQKGRAVGPTMLTYVPATEAQVKRWLRARGYTIRRARVAPFAAGSDTSLAAAKAIMPRVGTLQRQVLEVVIGAGSDGITCDGVEVRLKGRHQTISARVYELRNKGLIVDSNQRRPTRSGRQAVVWIAVEAAW